MFEWHEDAYHADLLDFVHTPARFDDSHDRRRGGGGGVAGAPESALLPRDRADHDFRERRSKASEGRGVRLRAELDSHC